jgi:hypothetical protein
MDLSDTFLQVDGPPVHFTLLNSSGSEKFCELKMHGMLEGILDTDKN